MAFKRSGVRSSLAPPILSKPYRYHDKAFFIDICFLNSYFSNSFLIFIKLNFSSTMVEKHKKNLEKGYGLFGSVKDLEKRLAKMSDDQLIHKLLQSKEELKEVEEQGYATYCSPIVIDRKQLEKIQYEDSLLIRVLKNEIERRGIA